MVRGSCLCGAVKYEADAPFKWMAYCHCSMCRKSTGGLFDTGLGVPMPQFRWTSGHEAITNYASSPNSHRSFCRHCGSAVPFELQHSSVMLMPAGGLDDDPGVQPQAHIFVRDKSPCKVIDDGLPQFATWPEGENGPTVERPAPALKPGVTVGSCLCGSVAFEFDGAPTRMTNCHCSRCRKSRGTEHGSNFFVSQDRFRWMRGLDKVKKYKVPDAKFYSTAFCGECGSVLPAAFDAAKIYLVPVGSIDTPLTAKPSVQIYVASKAPWAKLSDTIPQFPEMPPREQMFELMFEPR
jgi:hypothetical protein